VKKILVEKDPIKSIKSITTLRATRTTQILKLMMKNKMVGLFDPDLPADGGPGNLDDGCHDDHEDQDDDPDTDRIEPGRHPRSHPIHPYGAIVHADHRRYAYRNARTMRIANRMKTQRYPVITDVPVSVIC